MHKYTSPRSVSVAGASGYSGLELLRLLAHHPSVRLNSVYAHSQAGEHVTKVAPSLRGVVDKTFLPMDALAKDESDFLFLALPHTEALKRVPDLIGARRIIDLSGDFRLRDLAKFNDYYGVAHTAPDQLQQAVYGLTELFSERIAGANLVANPGCYATCAELALAPLASKKILPQSVSIAALSGVSGAGRAATSGTHFVEVNESVRAYKAGTHQHTPEIEQLLSDLSGAPQHVTFIPHLLPVSRGIHTTIAISKPYDYTLATLREWYAAFYGQAPFVRLLDSPPNMKDVAYTNFCDIHLAVDAHTDTLIILATLDNLVKGAAGQAIQNLNVMCGFAETAGLI